MQERHGLSTRRCASVVLLAALAAHPVERAKAAGSPPQSAQTQPDAANPAMSAPEQLAACARKYAEAQTYRDEGEVVAEYDVAGKVISERKPFATAFERGGRFRWEFRHSPTPGGKPDQTYTIWSDDQRSFESHWTLTGNTKVENDLGMAMAGPTGVSGGSATAIIPLLVDLNWGLRTTTISDAAHDGMEMIDDHQCARIKGTNAAGAITIWLDETLAIRKIHQVMEIDPSKMPVPEDAAQTPKFTARTTILLKPVFKEKIEDKFFEPPARSK